MNTTTTLLAALGAAILACQAHAAPLQHKSAQLACHERTITLEAECFPAMGRMLACSKQSLTFASSADGKKLASRVFPASDANKALDFPAVEEKVGRLACVDMAPKESYVVARMYNGGNCQSCEWFDVYSLDGALIGSNRNRKVHNKVVDAAVDASLEEKPARVVGENALEGFYFKGATR